MIEQKNNIFHLSTANTSYIFQVLPSKIIEHVYYGKKLKDPFIDIKAIRAKAEAPSPYNNYVNQREFLNLNNLPTEISDESNGDFKTPSIALVNTTNLTRSLDFKYSGHTINQGIIRNTVSLLQAVGNQENCQTLVLNFTDTEQKLELELYYTIFINSDIITKRAVLKNKGEDTFIILNLASSQLDLLDSDFKFINFKTKNEKISEKIILENRTDHYTAPAFILENDREAYYFDIIYSGSYKMTIEKTNKGLIRTTCGINFENNQIILKNEGLFETPEAVLGYSASKFCAFKPKLDYFVTNYISKGNWKNRLHPVIFNTRNCFGPKLNEDLFYKTLKEAAKMGAELIVIDDNWFGARNKYGSSLGDWQVNTQVLPSGIAEIAINVHKEGLLFGLWFAPELISRESLIYKKHPSWIISRPDCAKFQDQLIIDITREEVSDFLIDTITYYVQTLKIDYIKWNSIAIISDYSKTNDSAYLHSYMLSLYRILKTIKSNCPHLMLENDAGGNLIDLATFSNMNQFTAPDVKDIRGYISNYNTFYPAQFLCNEVTKLNHFYYKVFGSLSYSLDFNALTREEKTALKEQINFYKHYRAILQYGSIQTERHSNNEVIIARNPDSSVIIASLLKPRSGYPILRTEAANENYSYEVFPFDNEKEQEEYYQINGDALKWTGIRLNYTDRISTLYIIKRIQENNNG